MLTYAKKMDKMMKLLIVLIIIMMITLIFLMFFYQKKEGQVDQTQELIPDNGIAPSLSERQEANKNTVYLENMNAITKVYQGTEPIAKLAVTMEDTLQNIINPLMTKKEKEVQQYFTQNVQLLQERMGISSINELQELLTNKLGKDGKSTIKKAKIKDGTVTKKNNVIQAKIVITLDNGQNQLLTISIDETSYKTLIN